MKLLAARNCLLRISVFLTLIGLVIFKLFDILKSAFLYNIQINSVILTSLAIGIGIIYNRVILYQKEFERLSNFERLRKDELSKTSLIKPITIYLSRSNKLISQQKLQTIMASVEKRVDDLCVLPKYISGILIFLGLLGTFWGLSHTIGNVANIIDNLGIEQSDSAESFLKLKNSLKIPLSGMGIAFGCSLFGLASSLILGFLNINQKKVADEFLGKVEEWISKYAISFDAVDNYNEYHGEVFSMGLLEKSIETMYAFQNQLKELEGNRISLFNIQRDISSKLTQLTDAILMHQDVIKTLSANQIQLQSTTGIIAKKIGDNSWNEILKKLESIDNTMHSLIKNSSSDRDYLLDSLGKEIRMISKTISSLKS